MTGCCVAMECATANREEA